MNTHSYTNTNTYTQRKTRHISTTFYSQLIYLAVKLLEIKTKGIKRECTVLIYLNKTESIKTQQI